MSNTLFPLTKQQFFANNGTPLAGGLVYTYVAGTSTPQATYTASGATNTNPVVLDYRGSCDLWGPPSSAYKVNVTDSSGNQISGYPVDNIVVGPSTVGTFTLSGTGFSGTAPAFACNYSLVGNIATVIIGLGVGVSNSPYLTLTGVPTALQTSVNQLVAIPIVQDNSLPAYPGYLLTNATGTGPTAWALGLQATTNNWTSSGNKGLLYNTTFSYLIL